MVGTSAGDVVYVVGWVFDVGVGGVGNPFVVYADGDDDEAAGEMGDGNVGLNFVADPFAGYGDG